MNQNDNRPVEVLQGTVAQSAPLMIAYLIDHGSQETDAVAEALRQAGCEVYLYGFEPGDLRDMDALVTTTTYFPERVDVKVHGSLGYLPSIEQHESIAAYAAKIVATIRRVQAKNRPANPRRGWREDGTVDIDAVRAGTPELADAPAIYESLCDEVEQLRATVARFHDRHYPYPSADSPHAYCLRCFTGRKEPGSNFPEYHSWPCPDGEALEGGAR